MSYVVKHWTCLWCDTLERDWPNVRCVNIFGTQNHRRAPLYPGQEVRAMLSGIHTGILVAKGVVEQAENQIADLQHAQVESSPL